MKRPLSITELTRAVKMALESSFPYPVEVSGEVSNFRPHYSGHAYFTLKDPFSQIDAVMWKSQVQQLKTPLQNGQQVIASGQLTVYEKTGRYQLKVLNLRTAGQGDLQARFEALKHQLWEEGLFDESHKRPLPPYPRRIGLITSPTGAAVQDLIAVARRRNPSVELILRPTQVQGAAATPDLVQALQDFTRWGQVDALIIGRGGGSLEDLWAFNEEAVVRAIFACPIPVVSAVGHEVDTTLSDLVADRRAPTPSAAAEMLIPPRQELQSQLAYYQERSVELMQQRLQRQRQRLAALRDHHALQRPRWLLEQKRVQLQQLVQQQQQQFRWYLQQQRHRLMQRQEQLQALHPLKVLERGFVYIEQGQSPVSRRAQLQSGPARLHFADGPQNVILSLEPEDV